ncbi:MAG: PspC domain-containing protein [Bacillota bacterium]
MNRRLARSKNNKVLAGVCGGIAEYFNVDPTIIRLGFVIAGFFGGTGFIAYIVALFVMPEGEGYKPDSFYNDDNGFNMEYESEKDFSQVMGDSENTFKHDPERNKTFIGVCLIILGVIFLGKQFLSWFDFRFVVPIILIAIGSLVIFKGGRRMS